MLEASAQRLGHVVVAAVGLSVPDTLRIELVGKAGVVRERERSGKAVREVVITTAVELQLRIVGEVQVERETHERTLEVAAIDIALAAIAHAVDAIAEEVVRTERVGEIDAGELG